MTGAGRLAAELVDDAARLDAVRAEWDALAVADERPLAAPSWLLAWWRNMAPEAARLRAVLAWDGDRLAGIAPFYGVRRRGLEELRLLGTGMSVRNAPLAVAGWEAPVATAVAQALARAAPRPSVVHLDQIDAGSPWPELLARGWPGPVPPRRMREKGAAAPTVQLAGRTFDDWMASRGTRTRRNLRKAQRKADELGATMRVATTPDELRRALEAYHRLHRLQWGSRSPLSGEGGLRMMLEAGTELLPQGRFRAWSLEHEGAVITCCIFVTAGREVAAWSYGWDPAWADLSPGLLGLVAGFRDGFDLGARRVDLGEDELVYKPRLADRDDPIAWDRLYPRDARYPLVLAVTLPERARRAAASAVRRLPTPVADRIGAARERLAAGRRPRARAPAPG
jgi:CelD/BcsL family acetyltransferase involved in cellulose biosynthesis